MSSYPLKLTVLVLAVGLSAHAQTARATIFGSVVDSSGAPVANTSVTLKHIETNIVSTALTNDAGLYISPDLEVGSYEVDVAAKGFRRAVRSGIVLEVGDKQQIDFRLEVGAMSESVEVVGAAALVDTSQATTGKVIESARMTSLPLNGRTALSLVLLTPEVRSQTVNEPGFADRGAAVSTFSVNGGPTSFNNILLDGSTNITPRNGDTNVSPAVDAIEEFKVQSGSMAAEYGYTLGGVISLVTKSGTNAFHGTLYEFLRNNDLDSRNAFASTIGPLRYNQYGGAIGGPIRKNRTFFFFNFEEWRLTQGYTVLSIVPTAAQRTGDFSQLRSATGALIPIYDPSTIQASGSGYVSSLFPGNVIPASRLDKVAQNILPFWPLPNQQPTNAFTNANNYQANLDTKVHARQEVLKVDHHVTDKNTLSFRYILWDHVNDNASNGTALFPDPLARVRNDNYTNRNGNITDTHVFSPTLINEAIVGVARQYFPCAGASLGGNWPSKLGLPNVPEYTLPTITMQGYQQFPAAISTYECLLSIYALQFRDNVTKIAGKHIIKGGLDIRRDFFGRSQDANLSGTYNFNSTLTGNLQQPAGTGSGLASFLTGAVATASIDTDQPVTYQGWSQAYFVQDDWKLSHRLTLNLGLRYDFQSPVSEAHNRISNFNPFVINPQDGVLGETQYAGVTFGKSPNKANYHDFSPRAGFALDVFGTGKTAIRGGYGIYYALAFTNLYFPEGTPGFNGFSTSYVGPGGTTQLPAFQLQNGLPTPPIQPLGAKLGPGGFEGQSVNYQQSTGPDSYSQQWTVTIQQQLPSGFLLEGGYSGNKGTFLPTPGWDLNQLPPQYLSLGSALNQQVPNPYAGRVSGAFSGPTITLQQSLRPYPYYNNITVTVPRDGSSIYHSWLMNVEKRYSKGFVFLASYSFGKLIDDQENVIASSQANGDQLNGGNGWRLGQFNRRLDRSLDPTDSAGRFVLSSVYELPFGPGKHWNVSNSVLRLLAGGWQINGIGVHQDGLPIIIRGANNFYADRPNSTGTSAKLSDPTENAWFNTSAFVNPPSWTLGNIGRTLPDVRAPGIFNIDLSVIKNTRIRERWNVQLRAESFNFLNHVNLLEPNGTFVPGPTGANISSTFGTITSARDPRKIQVGLKLSF